jgi:predicted DNA-binding protein
MKNGQRSLTTKSIFPVRVVRGLFSGMGGARFPLAAERRGEYNRPYGGESHGCGKSIPSTLGAELGRIAGLSGRSKSYLVAEAVKLYLVDMSDRLELEQAIRKSRGSGQRTYTTEETAKELGTRCELSG